MKDFFRIFSTLLLAFQVSAFTTVIAASEIDSYFEQSVIFGKTNLNMNKRFIKKYGNNVTNSDGNNFAMFAVKHYKNRFGDSILYNFFAPLIKDKNVISQTNKNGDTLLTLLIKKHKELIKNKGNRNDIKNISEYIKVLKEKNASYGAFPDLASYNFNLKRKKIKAISILSDYLNNGSMLSLKEAQRRLKENMGGQFYRCPALLENKSKDFTKQEFIDCLAWFIGADPEEDIIGYMQDFYIYLIKQNLPDRQIRQLAVDIYSQYYAEQIGKSNKQSYKYSYGDRVSYYGYTNNSGWEGIIIDKNDSRYKVKIDKIFINGGIFTTQLNASKCSGNFDLTLSDKGKKIWIPTFCVE